MNCNICGFNSMQAEPIIKPNSNYLFIGEFCTKEGELISGIDKNLFYRLLDNANIDRDSISFTNVSLCSFKNTKANRDLAVSNSQEILFETIKKVNPKIIILLGAMALKSLFKKEGINSERGILREWNGYKVMATLHPNYINNGNLHKYNNALADLIYAKELIAANFKSSKLLNIEIVTNTNFEKCIKKVQNKTHLGVDIETTGLDVYTGDVIIGIGIAYSWNDAIYFPFRKMNVFGEGFSTVFTKEQNQKIFDLIKSKKISVHNSSFDIEFLEVEYEQHLGDNFTDSMLYAHITNENRPSKRLEYLCDRYFRDMVGFKEASKKELEVTKNNFYKIPMDILATRCGTDAIGTYRLSSLFNKELAEDTKLYAYFKRFREPLLRTFINIQKQGFEIDTNRLAQLEKKYSKIIKDLEVEIWNLAGYKFKINSDADLRKLIYGYLNYPELEEHKTKKEGLPSTDKKAIKALLLIRDSEILNKILKYTALTKLYSTYIIGLQKNISENIIHSDLVLTTTVTGRSASKNPNMQNIAGDKDIKGLVIARKGYKLIECDYKQMEVRMFAAVSKDERLLHACTDSDIYKSMASMMFGITYAEVNKEMRQFAKMITLGTLYGMGPKSLSQWLNCTTTKAKKLQKKFFDTFYVANNWINSIHGLVEKYGYVRSVYGRIRRLPEIYSGDSSLVAQAKRQAVNFLVQSPSFDYISIALRKIEKDLANLKLNAYITMTVHDSIIVEAKAEEIKKVIPVIKQRMLEPVPPIETSLGIDIEIGERWGFLLDINSLESLRAEKQNRLKGVTNDEFNYLFYENGICKEDYQWAIEEYEL